MSPGSQCNDRRWRLWVLLIFMGLFLGIHLAVAGTVYQYVDDNGTIVFVDSVDKIPPAKRRQIKTEEYPDTPVMEGIQYKAKQFIEDKTSGAAEAVSERKRARRNPDIIVYESTTCGYCKKLKSHLDSGGFSYQALNIDRNPQARRDLSQKYNSRSVPLTLIDDQVVRGFNVRRIDQLLQPYRR